MFERAKALLHLVEDMMPQRSSTSPWAVIRRPAIRSNSRTPSAPSISEIAFETAGCEILSLAAAFAMLPVSATAIRI